MPKAKVTQPVKGRVVSRKGGRNPKLHKKKTTQDKPKYGTSKLERYFAKEFLDRIGVRYIYQFEAKSIGRFYDFAVVIPYTGQSLLTEEKDGFRSVQQYTQPLNIICIIEVDGGFFHGDPRVVGDKGLNRMQQKNQVIDEMKNRWCALQCIPLLRIWEKDIRENPEKVRKIVSMYVSEGKNAVRRKENFKKPHGSVVSKKEKSILMEKQTLRNERNSICPLQ